MRKNFKKLLALLLCIMALSNLPTANVFAATSGGSGQATIQVQTKANYWYPGSSSITLTQSKQRFTFQKLWGSKKKYQTGYYGQYSITIYNATTRKSKTTVWSGGRSKKISLKQNCKYYITVSYNSYATQSFKRPPVGYSVYSTSNPSWWVSSSWKVSSCY